MSDLPMMVVFDAPPELNHAFLENGFLPHGRQAGAWHIRIDPDSTEARDLAYELKGVGLTAKWWTPQ
ncbi:MAG TPA: hypothetical protein VN663_22755 [Ramlibacter sp.]|nr:hypothetical protein [Ramlibacter sp.]